MSRSIIVSIIGLAVGIGLGVGLGVALGGTDGDTTTTTTTTAVARGPMYARPSEIVLGSEVIVPVSLDHDGSEVVFRYDVVPVYPVGGIEAVGDEAVTAVFPRTWTLVTAESTVTGTTSNRRARAARFEVPNGFSIDDVTELRLDSYALAVPIDVPFELTAASGWVEILPGVRASLIQAVDQTTQTIVQVALETDDPLNTTSLGIAGGGPGWNSATREAEGRPRWNLRWDGSDLPEAIPLVLRGSLWVTFTDSRSIPTVGLT